MSILAILDKLAANNSRNFKIDTLTAYKNDELLRTVVELALDPFTQFYQRKIPKYSPAAANQADTLASVIPSLAQLSSRAVTGNAAIEYLTKLLSSLTADDAQVLERIVLKDLKCGVAASTVNSVWPGLVHEYPVMLCSQFDEKLVNKIKWPAAVQLKMDGMRFNAIVVNGKCEFRSRNGKEINLLGCLEQEFVHIADGKNVVFDGELLVETGIGGVADRQTGNGILNKAVKGTISQTEAASVRATLWDMIPYDKFVAGVDTTPYLIRFARLESLSLPAKVRLVNSQLVQSYDDAKSIFQIFLDQGQEGIILKDLNGPWENKRAKHQIKFKGELECDLRIVGIQAGTGKYDGLLGAILCESEDGVVKVAVGSGFNDEQRRTLGPEIVGKVVAVKYNMRIRNKQGEESLFLPIFLEVREDKTEADSSQDLK